MTIRNHNKMIDLRKANLRAYTGLSEIEYRLNAYDLDGTILGQYCDACGDRFHSDCICE